MSLPGASSIGDIVAMAKMASQGACSTPRGATEESASIAEEPGDAVGPEASGPFGLAEGSVPESFATEEESVAAMLRTASAMPAASSSEAAAEDDDLLAEDSLAELRKATSGVSGRSSTASGARALSIKHEDPAQNEEFEDDDDFVAALARCAPARPPAPPPPPADARLPSLAARTARSGRRASSREGFVISDSVEKLEAKGPAPQSTAPQRPRGPGLSIMSSVAIDGGRRAL